MTTSEYRGPRGRGRPRREVASRVAGAGLRLFRERGFEATTAEAIAAEAIAAEAGIGRSTFFRYFRTKDAVLWHCQAEQVLALKEQLDRLEPQSDPFAAVAQALVDVTRDVGAEEAAAARDYQEIVTRRPDLNRAAPRWTQRRIAIIRDYVAQERGEDPHDVVPTTFAHTMDAAVQAAGRRFAQSRGRELHELVAESVWLTYRGFSAPG